VTKVSKKARKQTGALTRAERRLRSEVEAIASAITMDVWNVEHYKPGPLRAHALQEMRDKLVRAEVIFKYTIVDEFLTDVICDRYFHRDKTETYRKLWRTKRFRLFVHYLMDEVFVLKKLAMVEEMITVPRQVSSAVKNINDVRNALAHSLFPENRRRYMVHKKVMYRGANLFSVEGIKTFQNDYEIVREFFAKRVFG
jgi:hypothetical protein